MSPKDLAYVQKNQLRPCDTAGCGKPRITNSRYCVNCRRKAILFGDPRGRALLKREYLPFVEEFRSFIDTRREHPAVVAALKWLDDLLNVARTYPAGVPLGFVLRWLVEERGVTARDLVALLCGVWLLSHRRPQVLPSEGDALSLALANAVLKLRPLPASLKRPSKAERLQFGAKMRTTICSVAQSYAVAVDQRHQRQHETLAALRTPIDAASLL